MGALSQGGGDVDMSIVNTPPAEEMAGGPATASKSSHSRRPDVAITTQLISSLAAGVK